MQCLVGSLSYRDRNRYRNRFHAAFLLEILHLECRISSILKRTNYLDALEQTFMLRRLLPWFVNVGKRLVKTPKVYFRDSGLFHALQGIPSNAGLIAHPKLGASWEGFALEEILRQLPDEDACFYAIHSGSELDLYLPGRRLGVEIKRDDAPKPTRSMEIAIRNLRLERLLVVYPGSVAYPMTGRIHAVPLSPHIFDTP